MFISEISEEDFDRYWGYQYQIGNGTVFILTDENQYKAFQRKVEK